MRFLFPVLLLAGCPADKSYIDTDTAGCELSGREEDVFAEPDGTPVCVRLDPDHGERGEWVDSVAKCATYTCYGSEDVSGDGFFAKEDAQLYCVPGDRESMYRFQIVYCTPRPQPDGTYGGGSLFDSATE